MDERDAARIHAINTGLDGDWNIFKEKRREVLRKLRKAKSDHAFPVKSLNDDAFHFSNQASAECEGDLCVDLMT